MTALAHTAAPMPSANDGAAPAERRRLEALPPLGNGMLGSEPDLAGATLAGTGSDHAADGASSRPAPKVVRTQKNTTKRRRERVRADPTASPEDTIRRWQYAELARRARIAAGLTEEDVACRVGVSQQHVSAVFSGRKRFPLEWDGAINDETFTRCLTLGLDTRADERRAVRSIESALSPLECLVRVHGKLGDLTARLSEASANGMSDAAPDLLSKSDDVRRQLNLFERAVHRAAEGTK